MAAVRLCRPPAVEPQLVPRWARRPKGVAAAVAAASGQAPSSPAADRRAEESEYRSQAQSLPEAQWLPEA